jgi:hypothetical protein
MYTICNTTQDDVLNHVKEMVKEGYDFRIIQVGQKLHRNLDTNRNKVPDTAHRRTDKYAVNLSTRALHKKDCKRKGNKNLVNASIVNVHTTGLKLCKVCMP